MSIQKNNILVRDVMLPLSKVSMLQESAILTEALEEMGRARLGIVCVVDSNNILLGILTDGDIRRKLLKVQKPFSAFLIDDALDHSICHPIVVHPDKTLVYAVELMGQKQIWDLPVVNTEGVLSGLLHLHPAVQALLKV